MGEFDESILTELVFPNKYPMSCGKHSNNNERYCLIPVLNL